MTTSQPADLPFAVHPRRADEPEPDLTGFVLIHRALRSGSRTVADAATAIAGGAPCPPERHQAVTWFAENVLYEIHAHHRKEDDVLWPVIRESAHGHVDLAPLTAEHRALAELLVGADAALAAFRSDVNAAAELGRTMTAVSDEMDEHIEDEEATLFPVMRTYVSAGDFARCEKIFQKGSSPAHLAFVIPWIVSTCSPQERRELMPKAPLPLRLLLRAVEGRWTRRAALARG